MLKIIAVICDYDSTPLRMTSELIDEACLSYFVSRSRRSRQPADPDYSEQKRDQRTAKLCRLLPAQIGFRRMKLSLHSIMTMRIFVTSKLPQHRYL